MRTRILITLLATAAMLAAGAVVAQNCNVSFSTELKSQSSGYCTANDFVIDNETDWCSFWNQAQGMVFPTPPCPDIDFDQYVVIVTAMGQKSNGCYNTEITCIEEDASGNYTVYVEDTYPEPRQFCTRNIVCPVHAVKAPIPDGSVSFSHSQ